MNFIELAKNRYTTKRYNPKEKIADEDILKLQEILRLSPSSINSQPWKFTFIADEATKRELARVSYHNEEKINECSHIIVFSAIDDVDKFEQELLANLPEGSINYYHRHVKPFGETAIKAWFRHQVYLSLGFFLGACASMGIDSTPMEGIQATIYDDFLGQEGYKTLFAVAIGYRNPEDTNQPSIRPKSRLGLANVIKVV